MHLSFQKYFIRPTFSLTMVVVGVCCSGSTVVFNNLSVTTVPGRMKVSSRLSFSVLPHCFFWQNDTDTGATANLIAKRGEPSTVLKAIK